MAGRAGAERGASGGGCFPGFGVRVWNSGFGVWIEGYLDWGLGFGVLGLGFGVYNMGPGDLEFWVMV